MPSKIVPLSTIWLVFSPLSLKEYFGYNLNYAYVIITYDIANPNPFRRMLEDEWKKLMKETD